MFENQDEKMKDDLEIYTNKTREWNYHGNNHNFLTWYLNCTVPLKIQFSVLQI